MSPDSDTIVASVGHTCYWTAHEPCINRADPTCHNSRKITSDHVRKQPWIVRIKWPRNFSSFKERLASILKVQRMALASRVMTERSAGALAPPHIDKTDPAAAAALRHAAIGDTHARHAEPPAVLPPTNPHAPPPPPAALPPLPPLLAAEQRASHLARARVLRQRTCARPLPLAALRDLLGSGTYLGKWRGARLQQGTPGQALSRTAPGTGAGSAVSLPRLADVPPPPPPPPNPHNEAPTPPSPNPA